MAGNTVVVSAGTYNEQVTVKSSGTATAPVVFTAAPEASVVVTGMRFLERSLAIPGYITGK